MKLKDLCLLSLVLAANSSSTTTFAQTLAESHGETPLTGVGYFFFSSESRPWDHAPDSGRANHSIVLANRTDDTAACDGIVRGQERARSQDEFMNDVEEQRTVSFPVHANLAPHSSSRFIVWEESSLGKLRSGSELQSVRVESMTCTDSTGRPVTLGTLSTTPSSSLRVTTTQANDIVLANRYEGGAESIFTAKLDFSDPTLTGNSHCSIRARVTSMMNPENIIRTRTEDFLVVLSGAQTTSISRSLGFDSLVGAEIVSSQCWGM